MGTIYKNKGLGIMGDRKEEKYDKIKEKERERMHSFYKIVYIILLCIFFFTSLNCYSKNVFEFQLDYACLLTKFYFEIAVHSVHTHICFLNILYLLQTFILWNHRTIDLPFIPSCIYTVTSASSSFLFVLVF